ncbi:hypothetical protein EON79_10230 [bacterium]|nr:MAG: hypothetical protein EON79_10230 [bacterium]
MNNVAIRIQTTVAENPIAEALTVAGHEVMTDEQMALVQLSQVQDRRKQLVEWEDELKERLLTHYLETGEKPFVAGGPALEVRERTNYLYDDEAFRLGMPDLYGRVSKVDGTKLNAAIKAGFVKDKEIENFRATEKKPYVMVGRAK